MTNRAKRRSHPKRNRRVWVNSELNHDLRPAQIATIITRAGLEQARREALARAEHEARSSREVAAVTTTETDHA
ncbi:hypothetical protein [Microbacterium candidum]|uniref:Uncharacterized protein n=1 Tax=Microbacterium candidum TaxID=3041922 RepID=A0ABT7N073_9MICO|nr:hypothetical protein [Microbacterium sp. ASV49]MDL9980099.1 hypothetical protein [Microbacterium sp. ASV49]